jgi:hypothetical protein
VTRRNRTCSTAAPRSRRSSLRRQRLEQPREHERQRLEPFDRPLEIERRFEALRFERRDERADVFAARDRLPRHRRPAEPRDEFVRGQRGQLPKRFQSPMFERRARKARRVFGIKIFLRAQRAPRSIVDVDVFDDVDRDRCQRVRFAARLDDGEPRPGERE